MVALLPTRKRGRKPAPRRWVSSRLLRAVEESRQPVCVLAIVAGFPNYTALSGALHNPVSTTPLMLARLRRLADVVGCPPEQIFSDGFVEVVREVEL